MEAEASRMCLTLRYARSCSRTEISSVGTSGTSIRTAPSVYAVYKGAPPTISWIDVFSLNNGTATSKISGSSASFAPISGSVSPRSREQLRLATVRDWTAAVGKAGEEVRYASSILIRDLVAGKTILEIKNVEKGPVAWSRDGRMVAAVEGEEGYRVGVWDARTGERRGRVLGHNDRVTQMSFTLEGRLVTLGRDGTVRITNVEKGKTEARLVLPVSGCSAKLLELSADGRTITSVWGGGSVYIWTPETSTVDSYEMDAKRQTEGWALCAGADGRYLVCRTEDGFDVMDLRNGEVMAEVKRSEDDGVVYTAAAWVDSSEGRGQGVVVMGRMDGVVEVWDASVAKA